MGDPQPMAGPYYGSLLGQDVDPPRVSLGSTKEFLGPVWVMKKVEKLIEFSKMETVLRYHLHVCFIPCPFIKIKVCIFKKKNGP